MCGKFVIKRVATMLMFNRSLSFFQRQHDEGGPLMLQESGKWTVVGTASYVRDDKCGEEKNPYMYAHISLYSDWIWKTVAENGG